MSVESKLSKPAVPWQSVLGPRLQGISGRAMITGHMRLSSRRFAGRLVLMRKATDPQESTHGILGTSGEFLFSPAELVFSLRTTKKINWQ